MCSWRCRAAPDSVALLHLLRELDERGELTLVGAAHLNHGCAATPADEDEAFCAALAGRLGVPFDAARVNVQALAREQRRSSRTQAARRGTRFSRRPQIACRPTSIAIAHTRDDQAETFLLRLMRGSGTRGLGGIRPRGGRVVRPLLDVARADLRRYARGSIGLHSARMPRTHDVTIPRNRVRHELLPLSRSHEFSPGIVDVLAREADHRAQDDDCLQREAIEMARSDRLTVIAGSRRRRPN